MVSQGLTASRGSPAMAELLYDTPVVTALSSPISSPALPHTNVVDILTISGANFGPSTALSFSPVQPRIQVNMHYGCVSNATGVAGCLAGTVTVLSDSTVTFPSTLGVGVNKPLTVSVVDSGLLGTFTQTSAALTFSYAAPQITGLLNSPVLMTDGSVGQQPAELQVRSAMRCATARTPLIVSLLPPTGRPNL